MPSLQEQGSVLYQYLDKQPPWYTDKADYDKQVIESKSPWSKLQVHSQGKCQNTECEKGDSGAIEYTRKIGGVLRDYNMYVGHIACEGT